MNTIQNLFQQAQLAEAAYANFAAFPNNVTGALKEEGFSNQQAAAFVTQWKVVNQYTASAWGGLTDGSGFSATLFESLDNPGQYTFSIRGSHSWVDFTEADLSLGTGGIAFEQLLTMVNYALRLDVGATDQTAQLKVNPLGPSFPPVWSGAMVQGEGPGISLNNLTVTGHSLGGYLGMVFQRIFGGGSNDLSTFNAPGFLLSDYPVFDQLTSLLGLPADTMAAVQGTNLVVPGDSLFGLGTAPGGRQIIFSETENSATPFAAHDKSALTDSLAVYSLFAQLEPMASLNTLTAILKAESNIAANSLESAVSALGKLFNVSGTVFSGNETNGATCVVLFGREKCVAANDTAFAQRKVA